MKKKILFSILLAIILLTSVNMNVKAEDENLMCKCVYEIESSKNLKAFVKVTDVNDVTTYCEYTETQYMKVGCNFDSSFIADSFKDSQKYFCPNIYVTNAVAGGNNPVTTNYTFSMKSDNAMPGAGGIWKNGISKSNESIINNTPPQTSDPGTSNPTAPSGTKECPYYVNNINNSNMFLKYTYKDGTVTITHTEGPRLTFEKVSDLGLNDFVKDGKIVCPNVYLCYVAPSGSSGIYYYGKKEDLLNKNIQGCNLGDIQVVPPGGGPGDIEPIGTDMPGISPNAKTCEEFLGEGMITLLNYTFLAIKILVPILFIVLSILEYLKAIPEDNADSLKKANQKTITRAVIVIIIFLLPVVIDLFGYFTGWDTSCVIN